MAILSANSYRPGLPVTHFLMGVLLLAFFSAQVLAGLAAQFHWPAVGEIAGFVSATLFPKFELGWLFRAETVPWAGLTAWASTLTLGLALAIARMNRREISYAAD